MKFSILPELELTDLNAQKTMWSCWLVVSPKLSEKAKSSYRENLHTRDLFAKQYEA
jgi:hypothetical protein